MKKLIKPFIFVCLMAGCCLFGLAGCALGSGGTDGVIPLATPVLQITENTYLEWQFSPYASHCLMTINGGEAQQVNDFDYDLKVRC